MKQYAEENDLIKNLVAGSPGAYETLYNKNRDWIFNKVCSVLHDEWETEEVVQDIFIEIFESISKFKGASSLNTWIYRITATKSLEFIRKKKAQKRFAFVTSLFGKEDAINQSDNSSFYHPGVQLENKERAAILFNGRPYCVL